MTLISIENTIYDNYPDIYNNIYIIILYNNKYDIIKHNSLINL